MKSPCLNQKLKALTLTEVLVVTVVLCVLAFLAYLTFHHPKTARRIGAPRNRVLQINCVNNLKQISLAARIWANDHDNKYPMEIAATNNAMRELMADGNTTFLWLSMSNELSTPRILHCPADTKDRTATSFGKDFSDDNVSYFFNLDTDVSNPQTVSFGDDNLIVGGEAVRPGVLKLGANADMEWTPERHRGGGNIALGDGSVQETTSSRLRQYFQQTDVATNHLVIP